VKTCPSMLRSEHSQRADSNETLLNSGGHLPGEVTAACSLMTSIAMRILRDLYYSIPLAELTPVRPFPHLPTEVSPFFPLLISTAMWILRNLHHSIPLDLWIPTPSVPILFDRWFNSYPYLSTLVLWPTTFKLLVTKYYSFLYYL